MSERAREYQLVRPDGTVLTNGIAAEQYMPPGGPEVLWGASILGDIPIRGRCYGRWREVPDGPWQVIASYPDGFPGPPVLWDNTGEGNFKPYDPDVPEEVRGPEVRALGGHSG